MIAPVPLTSLPLRSALWTNYMSDRFPGSGVGGLDGPDKVKG